MRGAGAALAHAIAKTSFTRDLCMRSVLDDYDLIPTNVTLGHDYDNAMEGWELSNQHTDTNWKTGAPLYFRGPNGHVCLGMPNGMVRSTKPGSTEMITCTLAEIVRLSGDPYLGWSDTFAGVPIDFSSTAGGNVSPFPSSSKGHNMYLARDSKSGTVWLCSDTATVPVANPSDWNVLATFLRDGAAGTVDLFPNDVQTVQAYIAKLKAAGAGAVDTAALTKSITDAVSKLEITATANAPAIAAAVKGALLENFAAIPAAVIVEQKKPGN